MTDLAIPDIREYLYFKLLPQIPRGMVTTYQALAEALGDIVATKTVARLLSENPYAPQVPCHRVVYSDGRVGGYSQPGGVAKKIELLRSEGIQIIGDRIMNFSDVLFREFVTDYPLRALRERQLEVCRRAKIADDFSDRYIVGVDTSYDGDNAFSCAVVQEGKSYNLYFYRCEVKFPYIPTYLSFREFQPIKGVIELLPREVIRDAIFLIDGNGILHPFRCGLASYVGVMLDLPTIGVSKSKLCGQIQDDKIYVDSELVGRVIRKHKREIYVSPGNRVSVETSYKVVVENIKYGQPEVLRLAHIHSNMYRKKVMTSLCIQREQ